MLTNSLSGRGRGRGRGEGEGEAKWIGQRRQGARGKLRTCQWPLGQPFLCSMFERGTSVPHAGSRRWIRHSGAEGGSKEGNSKRPCGAAVHCNAYSCLSHGKKVEVRPKCCRCRYNWQQRTALWAPWPIVHVHHCSDRGGRGEVLSNIRTISIADGVNLYQRKLIRTSSEPMPVPNLPRIHNCERRCDKWSVETTAAVQSH